MKYINLNCHSDTELHNRLINLLKSNNTQFYRLTNPLFETRHLPKFSWLAVAISYFRDVIYIPSCRPLLFVSRHTAFLTDCTALSCSRWKGENCTALSCSRWKGENCTALSCSRWKGENCTALSNSRWKGENCTALCCSRWKGENSVACFGRDVDKHQVTCKPSRPLTH